MESAESFEKFRDDLFLANYTLSSDNAMEYFCRSRFFDPHSLNQQRRKGLTIPADADGIDYRLVYSNPAGRDEITPHVRQTHGATWNFPNTFGVFVIQRFRREKSQETPMDNYYIVSGTIYKAPSLAAIIRRRLSTCLKAIDESVDITSHLCRWSLTTGYSWGECTVEPVSLSSDDDDDEWCEGDRMDEQFDAESRKSEVSDLEFDVLMDDATHTSGRRLSSRPLTRTQNTSATEKSTSADVTEQLVVGSNCIAGYDATDGNSKQGCDMIDWNERKRELLVELNARRGGNDESPEMKEYGKRMKCSSGLFVQSDHPIKYGANTNIIFLERTCGVSVERIMNKAFGEVCSQGQEFAKEVAEKREKWRIEIEELTAQLAAEHDA